MAAWKSMLSGSSCVRRRSSTGVRSEPPPNQHLPALPPSGLLERELLALPPFGLLERGFEVTMNRVFICTAGTLGLCGWAISEMPDAQNAGFSSAPGICPRNSGANSPWTVETCTPTFSNTRPAIMAIVPPPPSPPVWSVRCQGFRSNRPAGLSAIGPASSSSSMRSNSAQISSRSAANQALALRFPGGNVFRHGGGRHMCSNPVGVSKSPLTLSLSPLGRGDAGTVASLGERAAANSLSPWGEGRGEGVYSATAWRLTEAGEAARLSHGLT